MATILQNRMIIVLISCISSKIVYGDETLDYIATYLDVKFEILDNMSKEYVWTGCIHLTNKGPDPIRGGEWSIHFCLIRQLEPSRLPKPDGVVLGRSGFTLYHINGCMYKLKPNREFTPLLQRNELKIPLTGSYYFIAKTDNMPNWYVIDDSLPTNARVIASTAGESLGFVTPIKRPVQYKRARQDQYHPYSSEERYNMYAVVKDLGKAPLKVLPQPIYLEYDEYNQLNLSINEWVIMTESTLQKEANYLADYLEINVAHEPPNKYIHLRIDPNMDLHEDCVSSLAKEEAYHLIVDGKKERIIIEAFNAIGILHGIHTLINMLDHKTFLVATSEVKDCPRFPYRGLHLDSSRNFIPVDVILKIIEVMGNYKMNKLHLHLSDDEGWRLEIPGLEELTRVGGNRCNSIQENICIQPQLGSNPITGSSGSGFYTVSDYEKILHSASDRHIEVIPEFDMPGHAHAAIKAMEERFRKYHETDITTASEYRLIDPDDESRYLSIQQYKDNAINPCLESTYQFVRKIVTEVKRIHEGIQPLKTFHIGGDEVPEGAWLKSIACHKLILQDIRTNLTSRHLKDHFIKRSAHIISDLGLDVGAWSDGVTYDSRPFEREDFPNLNVYAYSWRNPIEHGRGPSSYQLADAGYKTIISDATHFYFDHPHEPDPDDRGFYWATRFTNTRKVFNFVAMDVYENINTDTYGRILDKQEICKKYGCPPLRKEKNIIGVQGQLWTETVRTPEQLYDMLFPRVLALAERSWHKASWEDEHDLLRQKDLKHQDWENFANTLGYRELERLEELGIKYHIRPPGLKIDGQTILANSEFPGLPITYSDDFGSTFKLYLPSDRRVISGEHISGIVSSIKGKWHSRASVSYISSAAAMESTPNLITTICIICIHTLYIFLP